MRIFLNTLSLSGHTGIPEDRLPLLLRDPGSWQASFPDVQRGPDDTEDRLARLRADLRRMLEGTPGGAGALNQWLRALPFYASIDESTEGTVLRYTSDPDAGLIGLLLITVICAIHDGTWSRLKACPDCRVVFYDHTRSRTKVWCGMLAGGPEGRACGTIAKVTRYRQKQRARYQDKSRHKSD